MRDKSTDDLQEELMHASSIDSYIHGNKGLFTNPKITTLLAEIYEKKSISKAVLARRAGMSEVYLHQVFAGRRNPSRDRLLCLCVGLEVSLDEAQKLLKQAAYAPLYPKNRRDAIITYGILHHMQLQAINDKLFLENEKTLS